MIISFLTSLLIAASFITNRLDSLYNDDNVVTSVSFSGLATDESVQQAKKEAVAKSQDYTDSEVSNIIKEIDYPVTSVNGKKGDVILTSNDVGTYGKTEIDNKIDTAIDGLASEEYVNAKTLATLTAASQNATNYTDSAIGKIKFPVESVNNKTGKVTLNADDVGALSQNNYFGKTVYFGETSSGTFSGREGGFSVLSYAPLGNINSGITIVSNTTYQFMGRWIADGTDVITEKKLDAKNYLTSYTETDPVFGSWKNNMSIQLGMNSSAPASAPAIAIGCNANSTDSVGIAIGYNAKASGSGSISIGQSAVSTGDSTIVIGGNKSHGDATITLGYELAFINLGFPKSNRLNALYLGDYSMKELIGIEITNAIASASAQLTMNDSAPTVVEHGKFYCFRPNSTAATAISLSPTFDNGKEDEAKLYLDYTTARSNITVSDSTITVLYEPNSYKLNAFDAPNGQSNRYIVELKWFATTATEDGTNQKFLIVNAKKVSE